MYLLVIKQLLTMILIVIAGFIFARIIKAEDTQQKFLSKFLLYFINPCLVISSFNRDFDALKFKQLLVVIAIAFLVHFVMILTATIFTRSKKEENKAFDILNRMGIVFTNCGFIGIPLIRGVFGEDGVFLLMGNLVVFNILLWTYGYYQMCGRFNIKEIITNPNIIGVCIGMIIFCLPVKLPVFISTPVSMIGDLNTATSMVLIGMLLAKFKKPENSSAILNLLKMSVVRLVVCSIVNLALLILVYKLLGPHMECVMLIFVVYICSMCPSGTSIPSLACVFDQDTSYASIVVSATGVLCIFTIPAFVKLAELFIK
ncbi:MAG: AEC family transporter [Treponema sp.]|nr:AEC family transporter [Treponema sp.]